MSNQVITRRIAASSPPVTGAASSAPSKPDPYQDRLLKLIPAEVVSLYLALQQVLKADHGWLPWCIFILLLIGNILYKRQAGVHDIRQFVITTVAYILWVMSIGGPFLDLFPGGYSFEQLASVLVPIFTFFIPVLYK